LKRKSLKNSIDKKASAKELKSNSLTGHRFSAVEEKDVLCTTLSRESKNTVDRIELVDVD
jgi:uncharacterized protein YsxB (DUF464 family)